jgi:hypothetical protein
MKFNLETIIHLMDNDWVIAAAKKLLGIGHAWDTATAVGMLVRLGSARSDTLKWRIERALKGHFDVLDETITTWLSSLPDEVFSYLEDFAEVRADAMVRQAQELRNTSGNQDEIWQRELRALLLARDDAQCVRLVLARSGRKKVIDTILSELDASISDVRELFDDEEVFDDLRLLSVTCLDPMAWWANEEPLRFDNNPEALGLSDLA